MSLGHKRTARQTMAERAVPAQPNSPTLGAVREGFLKEVRFELRMKMRSQGRERRAQWRTMQESGMKPERKGNKSGGPT